MSAKRRRARPGGKHWQADVGSPDSLENLERTALHRAVAIVRQLYETPEVIADLVLPLGSARDEVLTTGGRGRPQTALGKALAASYDFDTAHYEHFRSAGWDNVPPNKQALIAVATRLYPKDAAPTETRLNTVKTAIKRARKKRK